MKKIPYKLKRSKRAKRMRLSVTPDGSVVITTPFGVTKALVERFIGDNQKWVWSKIKFFKSWSPKPILTRKDYLKHKEEARILISSRVSHFASLYDYPFNKISIRDQRTRWGSCSRKGNLSFSYKMLFLPEDQRDYVVVHELCHLKEFNHSKRFWTLVEGIIPNYRTIRKDLKKQRLY